MQVNLLCGLRGFEEESVGAEESLLSSVAGG